MKTRANELTVTDVQRFCMHDGPGVRTTVFLKGCPLHCRWCHNPETQSLRPQILFAAAKCVGCGACAATCPAGAQTAGPARRFDRSVCVGCHACTAVCPTGALTVTGRRMTVEEILDTVKKDAPFYGSDGGLTVSGGEPTFQWEGLCALLREAKAAGIRTCLETCGVFPEERAEELRGICDLFLYDVKDTDAARLRENTGGELTQILSNLKRIDRLGGRTVLRCILIPGVNMDPTHAGALAALYASLTYCGGVELLPYHPYGTSKAEQLGVTDPATYPVPEREAVMEFAAALKAAGIPVRCWGSAV